MKRLWSIFLRSSSIGLLCACLVGCTIVPKDKEVVAAGSQTAPRLVMPRGVSSSAADDLYPVPALAKQTQQKRTPENLEPPV